MRWWGVGNLVLACVHYIFTCKQKDSLLEVRSLDWLHIESSCAYTTPTSNWCAVGFLDLKDDCFFVEQTGKMTIFVTGLALELLGRIIETFYMFGIATLWTSISSFMCLAWIKLLKGWSLILVFTWIPLVTLWSRLVRMLFLLGIAWWVVCSLMPHKINLCHLRVTCNCFDVFCGWL